MKTLILIALILALIAGLIMLYFSIKTNIKESKKN